MSYFTQEDKTIRDDVVGVRSAADLVYHRSFAADCWRVSRSAALKEMEPSEPGLDGEQETSAGLSHAQRVMRRIRITLRYQEELELAQVY